MALIAFVDKNTEWLELMFLNLRLSGHYDIILKRGDEAYHDYIERRFRIGGVPNMYVIDYDIPFMTGVELARRLRKHGYIDPIILTIENPELLDPTEEGINYVFPRGGDTIELEKEVERLLKERGYP